MAEIDFDFVFVVVLFEESNTCFVNLVHLKLVTDDIFFASAIVNCIALEKWSEEFHTLVLPLAFENV